MSMATSNKGPVCNGDPETHLEGDLEIQDPEETLGDVLSNERAYHQRYLRSRAVLDQQLELLRERFAKVSKPFLTVGGSGFGAKVIEDLQDEFLALEKEAVKAFTAVLYDFRNWRIQVMNRKNHDDRFNPTEPHDDEPSIL
ncbi:hypothetical protein IWX47DRAFT_913902 [Phyllosticta citricarpa]